MYDAQVRTTIDLPEDLHRAARSLARDRGQTMSQTVGDLMRRALISGTDTEQVSIDTATGLPLVRLGKSVTTEMVRSAADE
jgi:ABC-type Fe3+ transport system permease subunit